MRLNKLAILFIISLALLFVGQMNAGEKKNSYKPPKVKLGSVKTPKVKVKEGDIQGEEYYKVDEKLYDRNIASEEYEGGAKLPERNPSSHSDHKKKMRVKHPKNWKYDKR